MADPVPYSEEWYRQRREQRMGKDDEAPVTKPMSVPPPQSQWFTDPSSTVDPYIRGTLMYGNQLGVGVANDLGWVGRNAWDIANRVAPSYVPPHPGFMDQSSIESGMTAGGLTPSNMLEREISAAARGGGSMLPLALATRNPAPFIRGNVVGAGTQALREAGAPSAVVDAAGVLGGLWSGRTAPGTGVGTAMPGGPMHPLNRQADLAVLGLRLGETGAALSDAVANPTAAAAKILGLFWPNIRQGFGNFTPSGIGRGTVFGGVGRGIAGENLPVPGQQDQGNPIQWRIPPVINQIMPFTSGTNSSSPQ